MTLTFCYVAKQMSKGIVIDPGAYFSSLVTCTCACTCNLLVYKYKLQVTRNRPQISKSSLLVVQFMSDPGETVHYI